MINVIFFSKSVDMVDIKIVHVQGWIKIPEIFKHDSLYITNSSAHCDIEQRVTHEILSLPDKVFIEEIVLS